MWLTPFAKSSQPWSTCPGSKNALNKAVRVSQNIFTNYSVFVKTTAATPARLKGGGLLDSVLKAQLVDGPRPEYKDRRVGPRTELKPLQTEHASHAGSGGHLQPPHNVERELPEAANNNEETPELGHVIAMWVIVHRHPDPLMTCRRARLIAMTSALFVAKLDTGP